MAEISKPPDLYRGPVEPASRPAAMEFQTLKADTIECRHLTVRCPENRATVDVIAEPHVVGMYLASGRGREGIGLWADALGQTYLVFWGREGGEMPPLAIGTDDGDHAFLQVVSPGGHPADAKIVSLETVRDLVQEYLADQASDADLADCGVDYESCLDALVDMDAACPGLAAYRLDDDELEKAASLVELIRLKEDPADRNRLFEGLKATHRRLLEHVRAGLQHFGVKFCACGIDEPTGCTSSCRDCPPCPGSAGGNGPDLSVTDSKEGKPC